jgi:hypothetical protein
MDAQRDSGNDVRNVVVVGPVTTLTGAPRSPSFFAETLAARTYFYLFLYLCLCPKTDLLVRSQAGAPEGVRLNFIDAPPQEAFDTDVAALRDADGVLVVIDIVEGASAVLTCGKLRQCLSQARSIKPFLVLTKLDRAFLELQLVNAPKPHTRHRTRTTAHRGRGAMPRGRMRRRSTGACADALITSTH